MFQLALSLRSVGKAPRLLRGPSLALARAHSSSLGAVVVNAAWAPTDKLAADALTKNLGRGKFERFQAFLLGLPPTRAVRRLVTELVTGFQ